MTEYDGIGWFKEKCGGRAHHFLGYNLMIDGKPYLVFFGKGSERQSERSGKAIFCIPRPHEPLRLSDPGMEDILKELPDVLLAVRRRPGSATGRLPLPALLECWGCGWQGVVNPRVGAQQDA